MVKILEVSGPSSYWVIHIDKCTNIIAILSCQLNGISIMSTHIGSRYVFAPKHTVYTYYFSIVSLVGHRTTKLVRMDVRDERNFTKNVYV